MRPGIRRQMTGFPPKRGKAPWAQIQSLAEEDGWHATYDPGNPDYRVLEEHEGTPVIRQMSDVMENLRAIGTSASSSDPEGLANSPYYFEKALGKLDAIECHNRDAQDRRLFLPTLSPTLAQPYFIMVVVKNQPGGQDVKAIFQKDDSLWLRRDNFGVDHYGVGIPNPEAILFNQGGATDDKTTVVGILVDGSGSQTYVNGMENAAGDVGGTNALSGFTLGANELGNSNFWDGLIGPILIYDGEPSTAVRQRMESLLLKLAEPEEYEIPDALNIEGLALWLDGSDETTLRDAAGDPVAADGAVYKWDDKSNNLRPALQLTSGARPLRRVGVENSMDALEFDGTDDWMQVARQILDSSGAQGSIFVVARNQGTTVQEIIGERGPSGVSGGWSYRHIDDEGVNYFHSEHGPIGTQAVPAGRILYEIGRDALDIDHYINGSLTASVTLPGYTEVNAGASIGSAQEGVEAFWNAKICEIVIYDRLLSSSEKLQVREYLQNKWATPALP